MSVKKVTKKKVAPKKTSQTGKVKRSSKKNNLNNLAKSTVIDSFIKTNNGHWNHQVWLDFCGDLEKQGFYPIDFDQVGLLLEERKDAYFGNSC